MPDDYLDLARWPRRAAFEWFRDFQQPCFSVATRVDVAALREACHARGNGMLALAYHYLALKLANEIEPFRYRLEGTGAAARVRVHAAIGASATVLRADESFGFARLSWPPVPDGPGTSFADFAGPARAAFDAARRTPAAFDAGRGDDAVVYCTTLPWVHFGAFMHARPGTPHDSIPRFAFGRIDREPRVGAPDRHWLPLAVDVHHALMDGVTVGRFVQAFEAAAADPQSWLDPAPR
jgi:chloramphenicol O-acetyltransferase type A